MKNVVKKNVVKYCKNNMAKNLPVLANTLPDWVKSELRNVVIKIGATVVVATILAAALPPEKFKDVE